ncbi:hypothetical protein I313_04048 [Cryptococcus deuterogattii Ram5]|uniref:Unplaced genomic scaffold supercont1.9, whole genome shotgun sequence n=1 Tax=Cryptococcus deuterogattii Ram5 TaxID=1296110 RepID=A0A0D0T341_9TREE|nr:hypothetical protein I313_04048 [Cryptococcus deuterogattii Ram5]
MKEGNAFDSAEAGPSRPSYNPHRSWSAGEVDTAIPMSYGDADGKRKCSAQDSLKTSHSHSPSRVSPSATPRRKPHLAIDLPLHTSASEIFIPLVSPSHEQSPEDKLSTYSSLPPSPRTEFLSTPKRKALDRDELDEILDQLGNTGSRSDVDYDVDGGDETDVEEWWPARSRRPTIGEEDRPDQGYRSTSELMSPSSPVSATTAEHDSPTGTEGKETSGEISGIWELLKDEMGAEDWEGERIANFLAVPLAVEKTTLFGALLCLDGFLYNFTVLPIRSTFALVRILSNFSRSRAWWPVPIAHLNSILRMLLLMIPTGVLLVSTDASKMYHTVRGQDTIKLYVIFNALEIGDRLCCAFGQDVLDTLFARETLSPSVRKRGKGRKRQQARPVFFFALSLGYVSVFKKFEKENLFQIMCADIVERFQLSLMLAVIAIRNMIEMSGSEIAFLPKSFMKGKSLVDSILSPVLFVIMSEMVVDWMKHAFISKFNHVRASVYERFTDVLAKDVLLAGSITSSSSRRHRDGKSRNHRILLDQSPLVARRLGFASIPLACLVLRISWQAIGMLTMSHSHPEESEFGDGGEEGLWGMVWWGLKVASWIGTLKGKNSLVFLKIILGLSLLGFSAMRQEGMDEREAEDSVNDYGRSAVGESKEETEYNRQTREYLSKTADDLPEYSSLSSSILQEGVPLPDTRVSHKNSGDQGGSDKDRDKGVLKTDGMKKGKKWKLEEVERWTMVKRIW